MLAVNRESARPTLACLVHCPRPRSYSLAKVGALDTPNNNTADMDVTSAAHVALARKLAAAACVLLKNTPLKEGGAPLLPFDAARQPTPPSLAPLASRPSRLAMRATCYGPRLNTAPVSLRMRALAPPLMLMMMLMMIKALRLPANRPR